MSGQILNEIKKIPIVTRTLIGLSLSVTGPVSLGILSPYYILFSARHIAKKFELWRLITPFFYAGSGLQLLFDLFLLYRNSIALESQPIHFGNASDYAWTLICLMVSIGLTNYPLKTMIFWGPFMSGLSYMWSQINPDSLVSLFGLPPFKAAYFPFAMLGLDFFRGGIDLATQSFTGILSGYLIHYLTRIYPSNNGGQRPWFMYPPSFLTRLLDGQNQQTTGQRIGGSGFRTWGGQAPIRPTTGANRNQPSTAQTRHAWGTGNRLG